MSKKFFLISQVFYPDEVSTAGLFTDLCSVMSDDGYNVEVWCAQPSYSASKRQPREIEYKGIRIHYLFSTNFRKGNLFGRLANIITFSLSVSFKLLFTNEKYPVFTHTTPPPIGIIISFICLLRKRSFVYVLLDIFPEGLIRLGKISRKNLIVKFWNCCFIASLRRSTKIIVLGRDMQTWLGNVCSDISPKIIYIPHWQDNKIIFNSDFTQNEFILKYGLLNKFVVQYSGNMGLWNDMKTLGLAVQSNLQDVMFMFVGGGLRKNELLETLNDPNRKNVLILPFQPTEKLGSILTACHLGLVSLRDGLEGVAVPCKIYGILAAGVPVIAMVPENSEIAFIVKEENCGFVVNPTDQDALIDIISLLKSDENLRKSMGQSSRMAFEKKYTTRKIAERYEVLLNEL